MTKFPISIEHDERGKFGRLIGFADGGAPTYSGLDQRLDEIFLLHLVLVRFLPEPEGFGS